MDFDFDLDIPAFSVAFAMFAIFMFFIWTLKMNGQLVWGTVPLIQKIVMSIFALPIFYFVALKSLEKWE